MKNWFKNFHTQPLFLKFMYATSHTETTAPPGMRKYWYLLRQLPHNKQYSTEAATSKMEPDE
jgi:hypothetical protein